MSDLCPTCGNPILPDAAELDRLRAAETAALRLLNGLYHHDGETCANKTDVAALRAALAPEGSAGTHEHVWVDATNRIVTSGEVCLGCGALRAAEGSARDGG